MRKLQIAALILILLTMAVSAYFYPLLPDKMVSHWGADGEPNGYSDKAFLIFFMPVLTLTIWLLMEFLPRLDPFEKNIRQFILYYDIIKVVVIGMLLYIYMISIAWNLGFTYNMAFLIIPAISFMFYVIGALLGKTKRNWFIGIRTPWTMSSDIVWKKTHNFGAKVFKALGIIMLISLFFASYAFILVIASIIVAVFSMFAYSYIEYKKLPGKKRYIRRH
jgi:uncharacterized membrane protein